MYSLKYCRSDILSARPCQHHPIPHLRATRRWWWWDWPGRWWPLLGLGSRGMYIHWRWHLDLHGDLYACSLVIVSQWHHSSFLLEKNILLHHLPIRDEWELREHYDYWDSQGDADCGSFGSNRRDSGHPNTDSLLLARGVTALSNRLTSRAH